jgi:hypothetical protein
MGLEPKICGTNHSTIIALPTVKLATNDPNNVRRCDMPKLRAFGRERPRITDRERCPRDGKVLLFDGSTILDCGKDIGGGFSVYKLGTQIRIRWNGQILVCGSRSQQGQRFGDENVTPAKDT